MLVALLIAAIVGGVAFIIASIFDKTANNQWAGLAAIIVFILVFVAEAGIDL
jgi:hypothetical protein